MDIVMKRMKKKVIQKRVREEEEEGKRGHTCCWPKFWILLNTNNPIAIKIPSTSGWACTPEL